MNKTQKKNLLKYGLIFVVGVVLVYVAILLYQDEQEYKVPEFVPKSTEDVCVLDAEISRKELINKLSDSLFGDDYTDRAFRRNPVEFYRPSSLKFTNDKVDANVPAYSVGYMYDLLMSSFLTGTYHEDTRYLGIYEIASDFLYENAIQFNLEGEYWHLNRDSACYPLFFADSLDEYAQESLQQMCVDLYRRDFLQGPGVEGTYCPMQYESLDFVKELADQVAGKGNSIDRQYYKDTYKLFAEDHVGKAKDFIYLYELEGSTDKCKKDGYFRQIADHLLYMIENSEEGAFHKSDIMEVLNTVSFGLKSSSFTKAEIQVLEHVKSQLFTILQDSNVFYGGYEPYGRIETSYIEICMRDPKFFKELDPTKEIHFTYQIDCEFEEVLKSSLVERSCELNQGETVMLFSPVINSKDDDKVSFASLPYTSKTLTYLILLEQLDELSKE